jgi:hypothetical protein
MKRVIKMLEEANREVWESHLYLKKALELLKAPIWWETPEQYKKRTGRVWPNENAVYRLYKDINGMPVWCAETHKHRTEYGDSYKLLPVVCATEMGIPPADWKPEESK